IPRDDVGHRTLLSGRARDRRKLEEEVDDLRRIGHAVMAGVTLYGRHRKRSLSRDGLGLTRARAGERSADEASEERRGPRGPRLELRVELAGDEPRMPGHLDHLDEAPAGQRGGDDAARAHELVAVMRCRLGPVTA